MRNIDRHQDDWHKQNNHTKITDAAIIRRQINRYQNY